MANYLCYIQISCLLLNLIKLTLFPFGFTFHYISALVDITFGWLHIGWYCLLVNINLMLGCIRLGRVRLGCNKYKTNNTVLYCMSEHKWPGARVMQLGARATSGLHHFRANQIRAGLNWTNRKFVFLFIIIIIIFSNYSEQRELFKSNLI